MTVNFHWYHQYISLYHITIKESSSIPKLYDSTTHLCHCSYGITSSAIHNTTTLKPKLKTTKVARTLTNMKLQHRSTQYVHYEVQSHNKHKLSVTVLRNEPRQQKITLARLVKLTKNKTVTFT
jgi:hypothetical protein